MFSTKEVKLAWDRILKINPCPHDCTHCQYYMDFENKVSVCAFYIIATAAKTPDNIYDDNDKLQF